METSTGNNNLKELVALFLRLGMTAFGGPAAHIAMMHDEVVTRRKWLSDEEFMDLIGATNLIPGPNSTELAIHLGYLRGGWRGLIMAGVCFILPAMLIVGVLAWAYLAFGSNPQADWLMYGVKPVVIAIVIKALIQLGQKAVKNALLLVVGVAVFGAYFMGSNEIMLLLVAGLFIMIIENWKNFRVPNTNAALLPLALNGSPTETTLPIATNFSLLAIFLSFLKIGSVLYGSGYVLLAFLHADFVEHYQWLTDQQLIDAIAIGQLTPGPVFTTATFIGYILGGIPGAILGTVGIFLPSFVFVAISNPWIPRMRKSKWVRGILDGVNVASLGLMAGVTWYLGTTALLDPLTIGIAIVSFVLIFRYQVNTTWLILGGALLGLLKGLS